MFCLSNAHGRFGSQAVILPQTSRPTAMRCEAAAQLASWRASQSGQKLPLNLEVIKVVQSIADHPTRFPAILLLAPTSLETRPRQTQNQVSCMIGAGQSARPLSAS